MVELNLQHIQMYGSVNYIDLEKYEICLFRWKSVKKSIYAWKGFNQGKQILDIILKLLSDRLSVTFRKRKLRF